MNKFKYLKLNKHKKIRYLSIKPKRKIYLVFLHGFMSDLEGKKPQVLFNFCKKNGLGFLGLEYSGHGKSTGEFTSGNISKWTKETKILINKITKKNELIFVASSMGSWIALNQFKFFLKKIKSFIGIGSAPEFLEKLMWNKFSKKIKNEIIKKKVYNLVHGNYTYPITYQLIKDGRKNKVLKKKINSKIFITMFHGKKDEVVPVNFSRKILNLFPKGKKKLIIIKNGDHSLSKPKNLKMIKDELNKIIKKLNYENN